MGLFDEIQKTIFFQNDPQSASAQQMRQKIALAMLMKKQTAPKTLGEGLYSIGDSLGDAFMGRQLERQAAEAAAKDTATMSGYTPPSAAAPAPPVAPGPPAAAAGPRSALDVPATEDVADASTAAPTALATAAPLPQPTGLPPNVASWNAFATRPRPQGGLGVSGEQAAGVVGNLQAESTPNIKPAGVVGDNGTAFGAAQWRGPRLANLQGFARANGMDPMTTEAQQAFMRHEMTGSGPYGGGSEAKAYAALTAAPDPGGAASAFDRGYERSDGQSTGYRQRIAQQLAQNTPLAVATDRLNPLGTPADRAQTARLSDVTGMTRAPPSFGATASNRTGDVMSDADPSPSLTGGLGGQLGQSVGDTVQQRQEATQPPPQAAPPPPGPQLAQSGPFPPPPGPDAGGRIPAIMPGGGLPPALPPAPPPAPPAPQISAAPPDPRSAIRSAPEPEEYVPRKRPQPVPPDKPLMGPIEQDMRKRFLNADVNDRIKAWAASQVEAERAQLAIPYAKKEMEYKAEIANWQKEQEQDRLFEQNRRKTASDIGQSQASARNTNLEADKRALELGGYPAQLVQERKKREAEVGSAQAEAEMKSEDARIKSRTGQLPSELYPKLDKEKAGIEQTLKAQGAQQLARKAIKDGVITGYGANGVIASAKFADWAFKNGMSGNLAANTEIMSATLKSGLSEAVKTVNGEGGTGVSNTDVRIAEGISGSDPQLQMKTIKTIMDRAAEINHRKIGDYEGRIDRYLSGEKAEDFYKIGGSTVPQEKLQILLTEPTDQRKAQFNDVYGPGAAELELARFKRAQDRGR